MSENNLFPRKKDIFQKSTKDVQNIVGRPSVDTQFQVIFSFGNYHVHSILLSYFAFLGSFSLANVFYKVSKLKMASYFAVFLIPSVVFWSSGILKEAILLFALGSFTFCIYKLFGTSKRFRTYAILFLMSCISYFRDSRLTHPQKLTAHIPPHMSTD